MPASTLLVSRCKRAFAPIPPPVRESLKAPPVGLVEPVSGQTVAGIVREIRGLGVAPLLNPPLAK